MVVFAQSGGPTVTDKNNLVVLKQALEAVNQENLVVIFTKCDQDPSFDLAYAEGWLDVIQRNFEWLQNIEQDRIFLHRGKPSPNSAATTH